MKASVSHALLFCILGNGLPALVATAEAPPSPLEGFPEADEAISLVQIGLHTSAANATTAAEPAAATAAAPAAAADFDMKASVAEFLAQALFVFVGCGSAMSIAKAPGSAWVLQVALTFGIAITVLAYTIGHYSGGQMNCAVTLGLVIVGHITVVQGIANLVAQLLGSLLGATILWIVYSGMPAASLDQTGGLGTNTLGDGVPMISALIGEIAGTFLLMYVVLETAVNSANTAVGSMAPLAIGFAVFLAHSVLISLDGCSINPTRTTGPAIINAILNPKSDGKALQQLWIFWVGPCVGAALAAGVYKGMTA